MANARIEFSKQEGILFAYLAGEIDHDSAQMLRRRLDETIASARPHTLVMDFGQVGFMDSSGLGLILGRQKQMKALGGMLRVQHPPIQVERVLQLAQIEYMEVSSL